jgi:hypothetical protein
LLPVSAYGHRALGQLHDQAMLLSELAETLRIESFRPLHTDATGEYFGRLLGYPPAEPP